MTLPYSPRPAVGDRVAAWDLPWMQGVVVDVLRAEAGEVYAIQLDAYVRPGQHWIAEACEFRVVGADHDPDAWLSPAACPARPVMGPFLPMGVPS